MECVGCDWDPRKNVENQSKHGIGFEEACCVFEDPLRIEEIDDGDYDEERWIAIGRVESVILFVVYTERNGMERIISARKAEPREEVRYLGWMLR